MSELFKIVLVTLLTVSGAIIIGQIIVSFFIHPVHEWLVLKRKIIDSLIYRAQTYLNPGTMKTEVRDETYKELRRRASELEGVIHGIRPYRFWQLFKVVHSRKDVEKALSNLIFLSNSLDNPDFLDKNRNKLREIEQLLNIKTGIE